MPLGFRMLRGVLMGLLVRKDPYVGYVSSVGSFPFVCVGILHQFYVSGPTGGVQV